MASDPIFDLPAPWRRRLYLPAYLNKEAAELAQVAPQTVANWHYGYGFSPVNAHVEFGQPLPHRKPSSKRVFARETVKRQPLSYFQLVEVAIVAAWRRGGMPLKGIRTAHGYLSTLFQTEYPFVQLRLKTLDRHILAELRVLESAASGLIVADIGGQLVWADEIQAKYEEFDYEHELALQWHPRGRHVPIIVNPRLSFGAPMVEEAGIPTAVIRERYDAGESPEEIEEDLGASVAEIREALKFEGIALKAA